jgi:ubiquitin-conjugating enzyme E2 A
MKEYVRRVKATVEDSWLDPEEKMAMADEDGDGEGSREVAA